MTIFAWMLRNTNFERLVELVPMTEYKISEKFLETQNRQ